MSSPVTVARVLSCILTLQLFIYLFVHLFKHLLLHTVEKKKKNSNRRIM